MSFSHKNHYDCSPAELHAAMTDADKLTAAWTAAGARNINLQECSAERIVCTREVHTDVPGFAKKFLSEWTEITETVEYNDIGDEIFGTWHVEISGQPAKQGGNASMTQDGEGCVHEIEGQAKVSIPLIGGKLAKKMEADTQDTLTADQGFWSGQV